MPGGIVFRHRASGRLCCAPRHAGGCSLPLAEFRSNTQDNTGMPPLEIGLIIGGMLVLLKGVIIASMNQIRFTPRQAQCMGCLVVSVPWCSRDTPQPRFACWS
ncbi:uncharacterized protein M6G45_009669 isoform 2-T2 [Spheniscus humboldti]